MDVGRPKPHTCDVCVCVREMSEDVEGEKGEKGENARGRRKECTLLATLLSGCAIQPLLPGTHQSVHPGPLKCRTVAMTAWTLFAAGNQQCGP